MKKLIYSYDNLYKSLIQNHKVDIKFDKVGTNVYIKQNFSTPGIIINKCFLIEKNKKYEIEVLGYKNKCTNAFIWAQDINKNRLTKNYIFLDNNLSYSSANLITNKDTSIQIGILVTKPNFDDSFYFKKISLFEYVPDKICTKNFHDNVNTDLLNQLNKYYLPMNCSYKYLLNKKQYNSNLNICYRNTSFLLEDIESTNFSDIQLSNYIQNSSYSHYKKNNIALGYIFLSQLLLNDIVYLSNCNINKPLINLSNIYDDKFKNSIFSTESRLFITNNDIDLNRNHFNEPIIPDINNDQNKILSELHLVFQLLHNKLMKNNITKDIVKKFNIVKKEVIFTYQWIIVYDLLYTIIDNNLLDSIFDCKPQYYHIEDINEQLPLEFVLLLKSINNLLIPDSLKISNIIINENDIYKYKSNYLDEKINWKNFFELDDCNPPNYSKKINTNFIKDLNYTYNIENEIHNNYNTNKYNSLLLNDLMFCQYNELPCGQHISHKLNINPIDKLVLQNHDNNNALRNCEMLEKTPLLIYVLKESEIFKRGKQLTGIGGIIIGEIILSILFSDKNSFFNVQNGWKPSIPSKIEGCLRMSDIINYIENN